MGFAPPADSGRDWDPISRPASRVKSRAVHAGQRLPGLPMLRSDWRMDDGGLSASLDRADLALQRIERALASRRPAANRDEELRARVREVVEELDELIRQAAA